MYFYMPSPCDLIYNQKHQICKIIQYSRNNVNIEINLLSYLCS